MLKRFLTRQNFELEVPDGDFILRLPYIDDFESWRDCRKTNHEYLQNFEPLWPDTALDRQSFRSMVRRANNELVLSRGAGLVLVLRDNNAVIGGINLRNIRRNSAQMGTLGYWIGERYSGAGRMKKAVARTVKFGFEDMMLHRIEAACVPENKASAAILLGNGFEEEGFARDYLQINGEWRDHRLFGLVRPKDLPPVTG